MKTPEEFINQKTGLSINDNGSRMILSLNEVAEMLEEYATLTRPSLPSEEEYFTKIAEWIEQDSPRATLGEKIVIRHFAQKTFNKWLRSRIEQTPASGWIEYGKPFPPLGIEVLAFSPGWIDEDFNPRGIRIGFQNEMESEEGTFVSAEWLDYHDSYMTRDGEKDKPTLWMPLPASPEKGGQQ